MDEKEARARVVEVAHSFLRTPHRDCAAVKGHGVDCATMIAMVFQEAGIEKPFPIPTYSPQWFLHRSEELYINEVLLRADEIMEDQAKPGDLVVYKFGRCFAHGAIIIEPGFPSIIHAYKTAGYVVLGSGVTGYLHDRPRRFFSHKSWGKR